ncbi:hypothetical protein, partial [Klebsiella pneumoniae]|uniref:hypothetical protein n=1 Tax=Klebsiella pneumoniae TaxID=573 RepID=UPI000B4070ED
ADRNRSHWSTSKTPSYTKSVSWQHHRIKERLNWQKESTHLALNQIISIYLTGSGMAIISRITPLYFYRHPLSR